MIESDWAREFWLLLQSRKLIRKRRLGLRSRMSNGGKKYETLESEIRSHIGDLVVDIADPSVRYPSCTLKS